MKNIDWLEVIPWTVLGLIVLTFLGFGILSQQQADDLKQYVHDHECLASTPIPGHPDNVGKRFYYMYTCKNGNTFIREMK